MATTTLHPAAPAYRSALYEWLTTTDHKKIGILYLINSLIFFFAGGILALVVRAELAQPGLQLLSEDFYNQAFTMHASFMLFLFIIPILAGFGNYAVPLQIGAPDMAFPRINALSFWLLPLGGLLMASGFLISDGAAASRKSSARWRPFRMSAMSRLTRSPSSTSAWDTPSAPWTGSNTRSTCAMFTSYGCRWIPSGIQFGTRSRSCGCSSDAVSQLPPLG